MANTSLSGVWSLESQDGVPVLVDSSKDGEERDEAKMLAAQRDRIAILDKYLEKDEPFLSAYKKGRERRAQQEAQG